MSTLTTTETYTMYMSTLTTDFFTPPKKQQQQPTNQKKKNKTYLPDHIETADSPCTPAPHLSPAQTARPLNGFYSPDMRYSKTIE